MAIIIGLILGILLGLFVAFALAFFITITWVKNSNDLGDTKGTYEEFTGGKMVFISKKK